MEAFRQILEKLGFVGVLTELMMFCCTLWVAVILGIVVGWAWKPKWVEKGFATLGKPLSVPSRERVLGSQTVEESKSIRETTVEESGVTSDDLEHLNRLVKETDGGSTWIPVMDRSQPTFSYQAWRRDSETGGPSQYRSKTVFEDATPEIVRDFFWDDEFRVESKWDDMLLYHKILEKWPSTGAIVVHWIRKFPLFCSDREYTIGRRIWDANGSYYCVTKGVNYAAIPRRSKPKRVDLYYSSWYIRPVESRRDGRITACEVTLFHHEDMGIPWEIAKLGVRHGMWNMVKKIEPGLRSYQMSKKQVGKEEESRYALIAATNSKINAGCLTNREASTSSSESSTAIRKLQRKSNPSIPRFLVIGGAVVLACCTLDRGLLTKAVVFSTAGRLANVRRR